MKIKKNLSSILLLAWLLLTSVAGIKLFYGTGEIPLIYEKNTVHSFNKIFPKEFSKKLFQKDTPYLKNMAGECLKKNDLTGILIKDSKNHILISLFNNELDKLTQPDSTPVSKRLSLQKIIDTPELISIENGNLYRIKSRSLLFSGHLETMSIAFDDKFAGSVYLFHSGGIVSAGITISDLKPWFSIWLSLTIIFSVIALILNFKYAKDVTDKVKNEPKIEKIYYLPDPSYKLTKNNNIIQTKRTVEKKAVRPKPKRTADISNKPVAEKKNITKTTLPEQEANDLEKKKTKIFQPENRKNEVLKQAYIKKNEKNKIVSPKKTISKQEKKDVDKTDILKKNAKKIKNSISKYNEDDWFLLGPYKLNRSSIYESDIFQHFQGKHLNEESSNLLFSFKRLKPKFYAHTLVYNSFIHAAYNYSQLLHPVIARIIEIREKDYVIVSEYIKGKNLSQILLSSESGIPIQFALHIISEVCSALDSAYTTKAPGSFEPARITHNNLNLNNIIIANSGKVKVTDFGLYHACKSIVGNENGVSHRSLSYMAPEFIKNNISDSKTDIFALGSIFYEIITGRRLSFSQESPQKINPISGLDSILIDPVSQFIETAVNFDRNKRFSSAVAMYNEIQKLIEIVPCGFNRESFKNFILGERNKNE